MWFLSDYSHADFSHMQQARGEDKWDTASIYMDEGGLVRKTFRVSSLQMWWLIT